MGRRKKDDRQSGENATVARAQGAFIRPRSLERQERENQPDECEHALAPP
jgi:hypothetical protein